MDPKSSERISGVAELHEFTTASKTEQPGRMDPVGAAVVIAAREDVGVGFGVEIGPLTAGVEPGAAYMLPTSVHIPAHESTTV